jgi:hypothetical protein
MLALLAIYAAIHKRSFAAGLALGLSLIVTLFLATGKIIHRNYFLWWTPLIAVCIGLMVSRESVQTSRDVQISRKKLKSAKRRTAGMRA